MSVRSDTEKAIGELERTLRNNPNAEIKNFERLKYQPSAHTVAMCNVAKSLAGMFSDKKIWILVEAEITRLNRRAKPEDLIIWIEGIGVFVIEVKSHNIGGIRRFQNNVPVVKYATGEHSDTSLIDQPKEFAYDLRSEIENNFDDRGIELPALYFAGWLPNVSQADILSVNAEVDDGKVWLSDMLEKDVFLNRLGRCKNLTRGRGADRTGLELFAKFFGCTSGLRKPYAPRAVQPHTLGYAIDQKECQIRRLTSEQERLAFSPLLVKGPKVIRGVAGSGKTIVLANAVAERFLEWRRNRQPDLFEEVPEPKILVLCFNRNLAVYLEDSIRSCFEALKPDSSWSFPKDRLVVMNIDRYVWGLAKKSGVNFQKLGGMFSDAKGFNPGHPLKPQVDLLLSTLHQGKLPRFDYLFIDEGQDIKLEWFPLVRALAPAQDEDGPRVVVFYDEAQNVYGVKMPGYGDLPPWRVLLGAEVHPRGLSTIMRVGHRNTNQILSFSFNVLLGAFADQDPHMATFANIAQYKNETIPDDTANPHPNSGKPCVEKIGDRQYKVNFAVSSGPRPNVHASVSEERMTRELTSEVKRLIDSAGANVDPKDILVVAQKIADVLRIRGALEKAGVKVHTPAKLKDTDNRDKPFYQDGCVTVTTIKSAKGYTAHIVQIAFAHSMDDDIAGNRLRGQQARAEFHVACTRATLVLDIWGVESPFLSECKLASESVN